MEHVIISVENDGIGTEMGIEPGDVLLSINDNEITDVFDYRFHIKNVYLELLIRKPDGEEWLLEIEKDEDEDLGLDFSTGLMDCAKECENMCIFCFVDQLPPNMRESLSFYDDDARLSFLTGNYVTLTNMNKKELERIAFYHLSPINISVHSTDPDIRCLMLNNPNAGDIMKQLGRLRESGITMNYQIVLCKGINDGVNLDKTIEELGRFIPQANSLSVVPVGLSRYRDGLYSLSRFTKEDAIRVISQITGWQDRFKCEYGNPFVYAADEFYIKAEMDFPAYEEYCDFPQLENGVGMASLFQREFLDESAKIDTSLISSKSISIITGRAASQLIQDAIQTLTERFPQLIIKIHVIDNHFFGETITVSGLLTGRDIVEQLTDAEVNETLLVPSNALRVGTDVFLDDMTIGDLERALNVKVVPLASMGREFMELIQDTY